MTLAKDIEAFRSDEADRIRRLSLGGLDYAISVFTWPRSSLAEPLAGSDTVYLVMQLKLFADIGGAGLPSMDGIPMVKLDRSAGHVMTDEEVDDRTQLRREFLDRTLLELTERFRLRTVA